MGKDRFSGAMAALNRRSSLLLRFLHNAFLPFVGWPEIRALCQLCVGPEGPRQVWADLRRKMSAGGKNIRGQYQAHGFSVAYSAITLVQYVLFSKPERWWDDPEPHYSGSYLGESLVSLYGPTLEALLRTGQINALRRSGPAQPLANHFLTALEAECPPPYWLPRL